MYLIGIDIGTGSTKAVATDPSGKIIYTSQASYPTLAPLPSYAEQDPVVIWQAFVTCIAQVTTMLEKAPAAISISSAMHSVIPIDKHGTPLMNMITWADNRSADIAKIIRHSKTGKQIYEETGTPLHAMTPLCKIMWLKENAPSLFNEAHKFISIKEYIWFRLFGIFEVDHSIASATALFDIEKLQWHPEALKVCGIEDARLSSPVSTSHKRSILDSQVATQLHIPTGVPFIIGASDGCLANLGSFATRPGIAALTIGTSGAIRVANATPIRNFESMTFNYVLDEYTYICGGPINNGGIALKWYAENFLNRKLVTAEDYEVLLQYIDDVPAGSDGLLFLPYILGERAPIWNSESCGVFFGITARHRQAHFTRAVLEGIVLALYQISTKLEQGGLNIRQINASGGFVHSVEWLQILADIFGKKICLINDGDASATGAAYIGLKTLGVIEDYNQLAPAEIKTFLPNESNHLIYRKDVFPRYEHLYKALMMEMSILHETLN